MAVKYTELGAIIYLAMGLYLLAALLAVLARPKAAAVVFPLGFAAACAAVSLRAWQTAQPPMTNLFEVFIVLSAAVYPISLFARRLLGASGLAGDAIIAAILLVPSGVALSDHAAPLPPALQSPLFVPHVAAYVLAYVILIMAAVQAGGEIVLGSRGRAGGQAPYATAAHNLVMLGFPLMTLALLLGAVWGKLAWGDYWNWDPKELWSLATMLVYVGYFHVYYFVRPRRAKLNASLVVLGAVFVLVTLLWVNLSRHFTGLHSYAT